MVYKETKEIIDEAVKQYEAFENYVKYLDKKITSFQRKKVDAFVETHELKEQRKKEILESPRQRKRLYTLKIRNAGVVPSSSRNAELDYEEIEELETVLKPSEDRIREIEERIETLKFAETKKALFHEVDIAQSMYEEVVWSLMKASLYEKAHSAQEKIKTDVEQKWRKFEKEVKDKQGYEYKILPKYEGFWKPEEKDLWKTLAEEEYRRQRNLYYSNLEKILNKRKEDQKNG